LCPISTTKDELLARNCPIRLKPVCATNSRPVQFSRKRLNRLKPAQVRLKPAHPGPQVNATRPAPRSPPYRCSSPPPCPARPPRMPAQAQPPAPPCSLTVPTPPRLAPRQRHASPSSYHGPSSASPYAPSASSPQLRLAPCAAPAADRPAPQHQPPPSARLAPAQLTSTTSLLTPEIAGLKPVKPAYIHQLPLTPF
jgi:hypothetical protein